MANRMDSLNLQDVTKSVDQLCTQLSLTNIKVPRIDTYEDVFEFISEFEMATATLPEEQRTRLLVKAFPPGRLHAWYESELAPLIKSISTWKAIKEKIIQRYSDTEDRDRHFHRLKEMVFVDNGRNKLYDYVEDLVYSFNKAFPKEKDDDTKIRFIKSSLPTSIKPKLTIINDYSNANTMADFMRAIRQYDILNFGTSNKNEDQGEKISRSEMVTLLKELVKGVRQEGEATRNVVATLQPKLRESSPQRINDPRNNSSSYPREASARRQSLHTDYQSNINNNYQQYRQRTPSPRRPSVDQQHHYPNNNIQPSHQYKYNTQYPINNTYYDNNNRQNNQNESTNPFRYHEFRSRRSPSPMRQNYGQNYMQNNCDPQQYYHHNVSQTNQPSGQPNHATGAFSDQFYYQKFGMPPKPCSHCQYMHWSRHCHMHLN